MLHVHRSERADALVGPLADLLAEPPEDPFAPDVVAVPTRGVERWLAQRLSHHLGAAPGGEDGRVRQRHLRLARPAGRRGARRDPRPRPRTTTPGGPSSLTWPLLEVVDDGRRRALVRRPGPPPRRRHRRRGPPRPPPRASPSTSAAPVRLLRRPAPAPWSAPGRRAGTRTAPGEPVPARPGLAAAAVAAAARAARRRRAPPSGSTDAVRLLTEPARTRRPARPAVGVRPHPAARTTSCACCTRSAPHRDVHLWLPHPSPALWDDGRPPRRRPPRRAAATQPAARRGTRCSPRWPATPASCSCAWPRCGRARPTSTTPRPTPPATLLGALQQRLRADDARRPTPHRRSPPDDRSVAGARLPRPGPAGRGAARGAARAARRRPDARAARRRRDVPGHRGVRPAGRRHLRPRPPRATSPADAGAPRADAAGAAGRPLAAADQPAARPARRAARPGRRPGHRLGGARPRRRRAGAPHGSGSTTTTSTAIRDWVGRTPACTGARTSTAGAPLRPARPAARAPGTPPSTGCCSAPRWPTRTSRFVGAGAAARRRRQHRHRPRRAARRAARPARRRPRRPRRRPPAGHLARPPRPARSTLLADAATGRRDWQAVQARAVLGRRPAPPPDGPRGRRAAAAGRARAARRPARRPADPRGLPHRRR